MPLSNLFRGICMIILISVLPIQELASASPFNQVRIQPLTTPPQSPAFPPPVSIDTSTSLWSKICNNIIQSIWTVPESQRKAVGDQSGNSQFPPSKYVARYGNDVVLRFKIRNVEEAKALSEAVNVLFLDVWEFTHEWVDIRLAKDVVPSLLGLLPKSLEHAPTPLIDDLAKSIYQVDPSGRRDSSYNPFSLTLRTSHESKSNPFFDDYQPLNTIVHWMRLLGDLFKSHVRLISVGTTAEGRNIPAIRVGVHPTNSERPSGPRKTIIISGGSHAREWISTSTVNYVAYSLITWYGKSYSVTKLLEEFDWVFIPTLNPDGYIYTWEVDRLWRKNRQETSIRFCRGIDLERAWGFQWDGEKTRSNPCSESYAGDEPFEAVEAQSFADWARNETKDNNVEFVGFIDLHSYSQQILYPYSYTCVITPPSLENLEELAMGLAKSIRLTHGEIYGVSSACEGGVAVDGSVENETIRMEAAGGSALDWFYHELGVKYSYQIKLRDTGSYGFLVPKESIVPTGDEILSAINYFGKFLLSSSEVETGLSPSSFKADHNPEAQQKEAEETVQNIQESSQDDSLEKEDFEEEDELYGWSGDWELRRRRRRR
ncbi:MAG: putative metallocarboxypeptidase ecm14 [Cirrosporium novae-zelandiae]|nr:MAG: putative metallocarboxypeptidase ecm14 [Cirrosporium novae-zelandiae]